jgi:hypothetical protein
VLELKDPAWNLELRKMLHCTIPIDLGVSDEQPQTGKGVKARPKPKNNREGATGQSGCC